MAAADSATAKILAIGDLHIGRTPGRLPEHLLEGTGLSPADLLPESALARAVQIAVAERFDAVVFAGDLVDGEVGYYAAETALLRELSKLEAAGIPAFVAAGNHDAEIVPRLARAISNFQPVAEPGRWGVHLIGAAEAPACVLVGWSHPGGPVRTSPMTEFPRAELDAHRQLPVLGVAHVDRDAVGSHYAPVTRQELDTAGIDGWMLGHIHRPDVAQTSGQVPNGYLGSLQALDPGEPGWHGAWELRIGPGRSVTAHRRSVAALRYEILEHTVVDEDPKSGLVGAMGERLQQIGQDEGDPVAPALVISFRVQLHGEVEAPLRVLDAANEAIEGARAQAGSVFGGVEKVSSRLQIAADPADFLDAPGPVGALARLLAEPGGPEVADLRRDVADIVAEIDHDGDPTSLLATCAGELFGEVVRGIRAAEPGVGR